MFRNKTTSSPTKEVGLSHGLQATRGILFILNVIFLIFGLTLFTFGIYLIASHTLNIAFFEDVKVDIIGGSAIETIGIILTVSGFLTIMLSLFGCLGALLRKKGLLYAYAIILIVLMILELAAFITSLVIRSKIDETYRSNLMTILRDAYQNNKTDIIISIEKLEKGLECCGVDGPDDYETIGNFTIPNSCHIDADENKPIIPTGCATALIDWMWDLLPAVSGIIGAILVFEIFGVIASMILAYTLSHNSYTQIGDRF